MMIENIELKNFIDLSDREKLMVLDWRNNENIMKWMYGSDRIEQASHFEFIKSLRKDQERQYYIVVQDNINIGVIYFTNIGSRSTEFGLYANPDTKIPGAGRILEKVCIAYAFDTLKVKKLKLEVFADNIQVINLHKKFNFKEVARKVVNKKEVICMELENENRQL